MLTLNKSNLKANYIHAYQYTIICKNVNRYPGRQTYTEAEDKLRYMEEDRKKKMEKQAEAVVGSDKNISFSAHRHCLQDRGILLDIQNVGPISSLDLMVCDANPSWPDLKYPW